MLAAVDATVEKSLAEKFNIGGYPTCELSPLRSSTSKTFHVLAESYVIDVLFKYKNTRL